ncbi:hypothetical protein J7M28_01015 [bacterium]|nr:hypothetical protein [bacterium]
MSNVISHINRPDDTMESSVAVFAIPFILALGVTVFFIVKEVFIQLL